MSQSFALIGLHTPIPAHTDQLMREPPPETLMMGRARWQQLMSLTEHDHVQAFHSICMAVDTFLLDHNTERCFIDAMWDSTSLKETSLHVDELVAARMQSISSVVHELPIFDKDHPPIFRT
jgi:hypothetical protein